MSTILRRTPILWAALWLLAVAVSAMALVATAQTARAASVTPTQEDGNPTCKTLFSPSPAYEIKVDPPVDGSYGPITVDFYDGGKKVDFTSTVPVLAVFVKGGNQGGFFYDYRPAGSSGDTGLVTPTNQQISHVSFCWDKEPTPPKEALDVSKTADATYDKKIEWSLKKTVDDDSHSGNAGQTVGTSNWKVEATKEEALSNFKVTGEITIKNPNAVPVNFSVTDKLDDGTMADVDCDPNTAGNQDTGTVAANGGTVVCDYVANPTSKDATQNNVQVSSTTTGIPGDSALAPVNWKENVIGDETVTLADPHLEYEKQISTSTTETFPETFDCSNDPTKYTDGKYSYTQDNTATLTGGSTNLKAEESVTVDCSLSALKAEKTASGSYDKTIKWDLEKTVDPASHNGSAGQTAGDSTWTVKATKSVDESNFKVAGEIKITNSATIAQTFSVSDVLDDGTAASVDCPTNTLDPGDSVTCTYSAATAKATKNTATVKAPGNQDVEANASVSYTANVKGDEKVILADPRFDDFSKEISTSTTETFPEAFDCSGDPNVYKDGKYSYTEKNTATLKGVETNLSKDATVTVNCVLPALGATKTADGSYDKTIKWDLEKTVDPTSHSGTAGQIAGESDWTVKATKSVDESNFKVTGEIKITNSAAIAQTFSVSDVLDDGTAADVDCPTLTVAPGDSVTCTYTASPTSKNATKNAVTVKAPGNGDVMADAPVSFTANVIGDETVKLADPRFDNFSQDISTTTTKVFPETFKCSGNPADYKDGSLTTEHKNTATLKGENTDLSKDATVTVKCTLPKLGATKTAYGKYDRTITWNLTKTVGPQNTFSGLAGDSFNATWKVDATKTVVENNYRVTGKITITNTAAIAQTFSVSDVLDDGTAASVTCPTDTVPANGGSVECTYTASTAKATENTATVKASGNGDVEAKAPVSYKAIVKGDEKTTLADARFSYSELISDSKTKEFPETFTCPTDPTKYTNYLYTKTFTNTATLTGPNTNLSKSADVKLNCKYPWRGETATGAGTRYPGSSNWFMYTAYQTTKVDLIAGQKYDAGDIVMTRPGDGYTYIKFTLASGFRWANVQENLKIQSFPSAPKSYVQPGAFKHKFTVTPQTTSTYTAKIPGDTAKFYGIHGDVERFVN